MIKNNPKITNAWCMYDWANSAYSLVIVSAIFPTYFNGASQIPDKGDIVNFIGLEIKNSALFSSSISFSFLIICFINPVLSAIADFNGQKKKFLQFFCYLGSISCALLFFFKDYNYTTFAVFAFVLATIGYSGSIVFYNSYLPEIATEDKYDQLSARGFSLGYIGSVLLLIFNLSMLMKPDLYGIESKGMAARISFLSVGVWWASFAQITFRRLPNNINPVNATGNYLLNGFYELKKVFSELKYQKQLKMFLFSFFFYNMGVQTVMYLAAIFGDKELKLESEKLIAVILILQLVAIVGAWVFSKISGKIGNVNSLIIMVIVWIGICIGAYFVHTGNEFYLLAAVVGFVMGGVQSLSRATYAKFLPEGTKETASYFSFYDITDKIGTVIGTAVFAIIDQFTNMRNSVLALMVFFIIGIFCLLALSKNIKGAKIYSQNNI